MSRFQPPSTSLRPKDLQSRRILYVGLAVSAAIHLSAATLRMRTAQRATPTRLTTQFVKRQPRLTKPLELKKRPRPKPRQLRRQTISVRARARERRYPSAPFLAHMLRRLARPEVTVARVAAFEDMKLEPSTAAQAVVGTIAPKEVVDVSLEMVDLDALDTGKYHAMVIQDPRDRRNIRGFFHLSVVEIPTMARMRRFTSRYTEKGIANLIRAVNEWTDIRADISLKGDFDSQELFKTPWIYAGTAKPFQLTASELQNVGEYLVGGGFFFAEEWVNVPYSFEGAKRAFTHMFEDGLTTQGLVLGRDWEFERLPGRHPIFHCFFDFEELPLGYWWSTISSYPQYLQSGLMGATMGRRLVGTFDHKTLIEAWSGRNLEQKPQQSRALQFGVNAIVFALTQEGSITHRVMEEVR